MFTMKEIENLIKLGFTPEHIVQMNGGSKTTTQKKTKGTGAAAPAVKAEKPQMTRKEAIKAWAEKKYTEEERKAYGEQKKAEREKQRKAYEMANSSFTEKVDYKVWRAKYNEILKSL